MYAMKKRPEPQLANFQKPLKRIQRAVSEIASDDSVSRVMRLRELEAITDEIETVWQELCQDADYDERIEWGKSEKAP